jgi:hypothetical protein
MARRRKDTPNPTVKAGFAPWAIINKETGLALGLFNPQGKAAALRRVAIRAARDANVSFTKVTLIPAALLSEERREAANLPGAPVLTDD